MRRWILLLLTAALPLTAFAQPNPQTQWSQVYGTDYLDVPSTLLPRADGTFLLSGYIEPAPSGGYSPALMKIGSAGQWQSCITYETLGHGSLGALRELPDRSLMQIGFIQRPGHSDYDALLQATDSAGTPRWSRFYGGASDDAPVSFVRTPDGGYLILITVYSETVNPDVVVLKVDSAGQTVSERTYGGPGRDSGVEIRATIDGNYIIAGANESVGNGEGYLLKVDANGDTLWTRTYGAAGSEDFVDIVCLADGSFLCAGNTDSYDPDHIYLVKVAADGSELWSSHVGGISGEIALAITPAALGGYAIAGEIYEGWENCDGYLVRVDDNGQMLWNCRYHRNEISWLQDIEQTSDGGFVMLGSTVETHGSYTSNDWWLVKTGADVIAAVPQPGLLPPSSFGLAAYPNPFNATTTLALDLPQAGPVEVQLVDALGRQVLTFDFPRLGAGRQELRVDASLLPSGIYFAHVTAGSFAATQKLALIK